MWKRMAFVALMVVATALPVVAGITDEVKKTVDEVVKIVKDKELKKNEGSRRQALKQAISGIFDFTEMARRSLGRYWNQRTPAERTEFVDRFATLLENSYANKIESYHNEKITYISESVDGDYSEVKSMITSASRDEFSLDYKLLNENGKWMVYDVVIEGVSLVSNYRSQFNKIISEQGYEGLLQRLRNKSDVVRNR